MRRSGALSAVLVVGVCPAVGQLEPGPRSAPAEPGRMTARNAAHVVYHDYINNSGALSGGRLTIEPYDVLHGEIIGGVGQPPERWAVHTVRDHGAVDNRVNIVVVGDGYRADEQPAFAADVESFVEGFFDEPPLSDYAEYFNVFRVDVVSTDSGVDEPDLGIFRDTALDMSFDCAGIPHLLCVDVGKARAAATLAPAADMVFAVAHSARYGGAGYATARVATFAGGHSAAVDLGLHEFGHAFAGLADEYFYTDAHYAGREVGEPNATIFMADQLADMHHKWSAWLDLPQVHTFEGCRYVQTGLRRPTYTSKMRTLSAPFREVNSEQLILNMYEHVVVVDRRIPVSQLVDCAAVQLNGLAVTILRPEHRDMTITWSVDGTMLATDGPHLHPDALDLAPGDHLITATVVDSTTQVRDESARANRMTKVEEWTVTNCRPAPCAAVGACSDHARLSSEH